MPKMSKIKKCLKLRYAVDYKFNQKNSSQLCCGELHSDP